MDALYRITSLEGFLSLLINRNERFVRPIDCWEDTFEGYMLHLLDDDQGLMKVIVRLFEDVSNRDVNVTIRDISKLQRSRYTCYGQCWSEEKDSDALWRIYSYGRKSIQLISSKDAITGVLNDSNYDKRRIGVNAVKYDIEDEEAALNRVLIKNARIVEAYLHKRPAFEHEKEVRVLVSDYDQYRNIEPFLQTKLKQI